MNELYTVRVSKDDLVFSSGHFITFGGGDCERLHGHNYRVGIALDGPLDENHYVFDFIALKNHALTIIHELDHHMLVATKNPLLKVTLDEEEVQIQYKTKRWLFPREDCVLLPLENTTVELLGKYIATRLLDAFQRDGLPMPEAIRVEVEENFGQTATYTRHH